MSGRRGDVVARRPRARVMRLACVAGAVSALAATSGVAHAASVRFETDAGEYVTRDLSALTNNANMFGGSENADTRLTNASALSENIAHIAAELEVFTSDWTDVTNDYNADYKYWVETAAAGGLTSNEWTRLQAVPLTSAVPGTATAAAPSATPITDYVTAAVTVATTGTYRDAAKEMLEKTLWDATIYQGALLHLGTAQDDDTSICVTSTTTQTDKTIANWDIGAALIIGDGYHSILGRANKRGAEFGTMSGSVASTYEKIVKLLRVGQEQKDCEKLDDDVYEAIEKQMRIVYSQSIIKYAFKLDKAIAAGDAKAFSDDQAEGQALYRVIAGDIHDKDSDSAKKATAMFNALFDVRSAPTAHNKYTYGHYCASISHLKRILGLTDAQLGTYYEATAAGVTCDPSSVEFHTIVGSYYPSSTSDESDFDGTFAGAFADAVAMSQNIAHINAEISSFTTDWSDITNDYIESYKKWTEDSPTKSNEWDRLVDTPLTSVNPTSTADADASSSPITTYLTEAVAAASNSANREAAKEMIEKTLWDATLYHGSLNFLNRAQNYEDGFCVTSSSTRSAETKLAWDIGAALIIGDGYYSILGRANKRGAEFGTMSGSVASAYEKIVKYLRDGQEQKDCVKLHDIYEDIEKQMRIVYGQSIIKYAYKIDKAIAAGTASAYSDDQAEGQALYRVIAGDIKVKGATNGFPDHYKFFNTLFDVRSVPTRGSWDYANYCTAIQYVKESLKMTDSSKFDFGTYHDARHIDCEAQIEYSPASYAELVAIVHDLQSNSNVKAAVRPAEALAAFSFIIAITGVVLGSIAVHKIRRGSAASAFKSSYVIQHI